MPEPLRSDVMPPRLHLPEEVAAVLGCSTWWVKDRARRRLIPFTRVGRAYRFTAAQLTEIIHLHEERPAQAAPHVVSAPPPPAPRPSRSGESAVRLQARAPRRARQAQYDTAA
ncbi:DNA-binding protein [Streptomyces sp. NPDC059373]